MREMENGIRKIYQKVLVPLNTHHVRADFESSQNDERDAKISKKNLMLIQPEEI